MFHGSIVALATPMQSQGGIDFAALEQLLEWHIAEYTQGIVIAGTTGESPTLTEQEYKTLVKHTITYVRQRMPIIVGSGTNATQTTIAKTELAMHLGADACLIVTPYYNKPTQEGLFQHYSAISKAVPVPQILYNVPSRTGCDLLPKTVERLANRANIVGIKECVVETDRMEQLLSSVNGKLDVFSGDDPSALSLIQKGGKGVISVAANIVPKLFSHMIDFQLKGNSITAQKIDQYLQPLYKALAVESNPIPVKWMMCEMGLLQPEIRLPLTWLSDCFQRSVKEALNKILDNGFSLLEGDHESI